MVIVFLEEIVGGFVCLTFWQNLFQSWYLDVCVNYVILFLFLIFLEEGVSENGSFVFCTVSH